MKRFFIIFLITYIITSTICIIFFGNMNFFGEQGFHLDIGDIIFILATWAFIPAIVITIIIDLIISLIKKIKK